MTDRTAAPSDGLREAGSDSISYWQARALAAEARTADPGGLREAWLAGWYAYGDDESRSFNALRSEVEASADAYVAAHIPEATAPEPFWCPKCGRSESHDHSTQPEDARTADPGRLDVAPGRWAFLDTETGDWIEVKPGVVHVAALTPEATAPDRTADLGGLRAAADAVVDFWDTEGETLPHLIDALRAALATIDQPRALTPEATAPGLCVERGGTEPCTHHAGSGPVHPGPALTGAKPLPALTPEATAPEPDCKHRFNYYGDKQKKCAICRYVTALTPEATAPDGAS